MPYKNLFAILLFFCLVPAVLAAEEAAADPSSFLGRMIAVRTTGGGLFRANLREMKTIPAVSSNERETSE